jgi:hypothetical protein
VGILEVSRKRVDHALVRFAGNNCGTGNGTCFDAADGRQIQTAPSLFPAMARKAAFLKDGLYLIPGHFRMTDFRIADFLT